MLTPLREYSTFFRYTPAKQNKHSVLNKDVLLACDACHTPNTLCLLIWLLVQRLWQKAIAFLTDQECLSTTKKMHPEDLPLLAAVYRLAVLRPWNYFFFSSFVDCTVSDFSFVISAGGCGGFFASVLA